MNIRYISLPLLIVAAIWTMPANAVSDIQYNSIKRMGELNGVALQCRYFHETRRMKKALTATLPKRRQLGQAFDESTNDSFMAFIETNATCPDEAEFARQVDTGIQELDAAFSDVQVP